MALSLITLLCAVAFFVYLCKYFRHKPFGNKVIDVFSITMCVIGFVNSEGITLIGGATFIAALIDLGFCLYIDYCDIKRVCNQSYFLPKEGLVSNYNRVTNLGGGIGYTFLPQKNDNLGDFELRASVTTSVGSSDLRTPHTNQAFIGMATRKSTILFQQLASDIRSEISLTRTCQTTMELISHSD